MIRVSAFALAFAMCLSAGAASPAEMKCAVKRVVGYHGARLNLRLGNPDDVKANFIQGTTVSGTMYHLRQLSPGVYEGTIKNSPQFWMKLQISRQEAENAYIRGSRASLEVVFPTQLNSSGKQRLKTQSKDDFVCGRQVHPFRQ